MAQISARQVTRLRRRRQNFLANGTPADSPIISALDHALVHHQDFIAENY